MKRIWSSIDIPLSKKEELMAKLKAGGGSDWLDNTEKYCNAAHFENKEKIWNMMFSNEKNETSEWGLNLWRNTCGGWNQGNHIKYIEKIQDQWFNEIEKVVEKKGRWLAESLFYALRPMHDTSSEAVNRYKSFLERIQKEQPDNNFFINMLKDTINDLETKQRGVKAS